MRVEHLVIACLIAGTVGPVAAGASPPDGWPVAFVTVRQGAHSAVREPLEVVVRTPQAWTRLWQRHAGPTATPPAVDFDAEMVVAVFAGERRTGGYSVEITDVRTNAGELRVLYEVRKPPPGALVPHVLTAPFHVIRLARSDERVRVLGAPE